HDEVVTPFELPRGTVLGDAESALFRRYADFPKGHSLIVSAILAGRLQSHGLKLCGHVSRGNFVSALACTAPFEQIFCKECHVSTEWLLLEFQHRGLRVGGDG